MSSNIKRKHQILDSDDEVEVLNDVNINRSRKQDKGERKKGRKRNVVSSDEDEDGNIISINAIKKKAKSKAKKLAESSDVEDDSKRTKPSNKTPPSKQSNTLFNYFKPANNDKKSEPKSEEKSNLKNIKDFTTVKEVIKISPKKCVSEEMMITTLGKNSSSIGSIENVKVTVKNENNVSTKTKEKDRLSKLVSPKKNKTIEKTESKVLKEKIHSPKKLSEKNEFIKSEKPQATTEVTKKSKNFELKESKLEFHKTQNISDSPKKISKVVETKESYKPVTEALPRIIEAKRVSDLWVDKYKPQSGKQVIGQQGDKSPLNKLVKWLRNWDQNLDKKPGFGKWGSDDGAGFRAALMSGPPGIGKTTTAQLACKELDLDYLELNASDSRNKKSLQEDVRELLRNTKLTNFFKRDSNSKGEQEKITAKHCVIMDEVDGMAGNEDRGGVQELIKLIKETKVPIICICNDRGDQKMRSLVNYCFDLKFAKPRIEQIKAALMSIAFKEKLNVSPNVINDLIVSSNFDIRQCIHNLSMLSAGHIKVSNLINSNQNLQPIKDIKLGPFDAIRKVFCTGEDYMKMSFADKSDLFFCDYSIMPLFVFENYHTINLSSKEPKIGNQLKTLMKTINSISFGELVEKEVRTNQSWSLLPLQAAFSTVMPGAYMRSSNGLGFPQFPQYMGKLSTTNKNKRLVDELVSHMTLSITGTRTSFSLDYLQPLRDSLVKPLSEADKGGVSGVLDFMESYSLTKENMDSILELALWHGDVDPLKSIDSKTKAALTRAYNKKSFSLPYATDNDVKKVAKRGKGAETKGKKGKSNFLAESDESEQEYIEDDLNGFDY